VGKFTYSGAGFGSGFGSTSATAQGSRPRSFVQLFRLCTRIARYPFHLPNNEQNEAVIIAYSLRTQKSPSKESIALRKSVYGAAEGGTRSTQTYARKNRYSVPSEVKLTGRVLYMPPATSQGKSTHLRQTRAASCLKRIVDGSVTRLGQFV
jgi:hypothetical protein